MLAKLQVRNYVLIDSLEIDFPEGLVIITGQTGAGKSILLGALSLLMGAKGEASMVSEGADNCVVEAEFTVTGDWVRSLLDEHDVETEDDYLIIRRVVNRSGRSRAFVNDCPVPVQLLQELSSHLIDIHSQHQTLLLSDRRFQMGLLDDYAGNASLVEKCGILWRKVNSLKSEKQSLSDRISRLAADREYNEAVFHQLETAALREGELEELEEEQKQLANAEEIKTGLSAVEDLFTSASSMGEILSMDAALKESAKLLGRISRYLPVASELSDRTDSCRRELDDILSEISSLNASVDMSGSRLEEVEARMSLLYGLMQRHSCSSETELIAVRNRLSESLFDSTQLEERLSEIEAELSTAISALNETAEALSASRRSASAAFSREIQNSIRSLELPYAFFEVAFEDVPVSAFGKDRVVFSFSSTGRNPIDIVKCASGGEMSRIMLSLKAMAARYADMPTMIFDEIDTGVSGSVADKMGTMICDMGRNMQVFAITHLPQVAAKGTAHYLVSKEMDPDGMKAVSTIKRLSESQRVLEVARMLSGSELTDAAIANAESLLSI